MFFFNILSYSLHLWMSGSGTPESEEALVSSYMEQEWDTWSRKDCLNSPIDEELFPWTHCKV